MKRTTTKNIYILLYVQEATQPGSAMRALVFEGRDLEAARLEALSTLKHDETISRIAVMDPRCEHIWGVVTRLSPNWQVPKEFPQWRAAWH
jgi:hypothetical protein